MSTSSGAGAGLKLLKPQAAPLRNQIIASLRRAIELGHLIPGTRLIEKDLCAQLGVSRTSLREALRELQAQGIVEHRGARGLAVGAISHEDAENVYRIRAALEALIVEQFIEKASADEIGSLVRESQALKEAYRLGELEGIVVAKRRFYDRICSGARNPIAFDLLDHLVLRTSSLRSRSLTRKERQRQSIQEIDALVGAIERRDVKAAQRIAAEHVMHSAQSAFLGDARAAVKAPIDRFAETSLRGG
ncbi:MAG TPA: GntR family transcriptional regulator [Stellaceae bacterium]|jgi:DNA-binding GntR family transcriptional regulator|nr:GntR family transcriptional regulator [Stellaceae bacterium]